MNRFFLSIVFLMLAGSAFCHAEANRQDMVTEQLIRQLYIEHPDSCLDMLDKAQLRQLDTDMPIFKMDMLRAMCYEIKGNYPEKERCVRRLLEEDSVRLVPDRKLKVTVMLAGVLDRQNKYEEGIQACGEAIDLARKLGKKKDEAEMLSTMARINAGMGNSNEAYNYFRQAIDVLKNTGDVREMSYLSTIYGEAMSFLTDAGKTKEAIEIGKKREALIDKMSKLQGPPPGYIDQQYGFLYAKMALLLYEDGKADEAAAVYAKFGKLDFAATYTGRLFSVPYLLNARHYSDALRNNDSCIKEFAGDTISNDYLGLLQNQADAYRGLRNYQSADAFMQRSYTLRDSIYQRESESKAQEYAALFEANEKELRLTEARAESQRKTILIVSATTLIVLLLFILWVVMRNLRITRERNRIDAQRIDELIAQKEELRKAYFQATDHPDADKETQIDESATDDVVPDTHKGYQSFMRMETIIMENKLFLNPKLTRDDILAVVGIAKNSLVPILRKYAGCTNLNDYINRLRLEYAVKLIKSNKVYTIDSIAESSGFNSRSTFYRAFQNVFGMSPSQYLEIQKKQSEEKE